MCRAGRSPDFLRASEPGFFGAGDARFYMGDGASERASERTGRNRRARIFTTLSLVFFFLLLLPPSRRTRLRIGPTALALSRVNSCAFAPRERDERSRERATCGRSGRATFRDTARRRSRSSELGANSRSHAAPSFRIVPKCCRQVRSNLPTRRFGSEIRLYARRYEQFDNSRES